MNVKKFREDSDAAFWAREGMREIQVSFVNSHQMYGPCLVKDKKVIRMAQGWVSLIQKCYL